MLLFALWIALTCGCGEKAPPRGPDPERRPALPVVEAPLVDAETVTAILRISDPRTHYVEVEATYPTDGAPTLVLFMPVWTPGSYLVREHARNVEAFTAATLAGEPLATSKVRKNRFRVETRGEARVVVRYRVYARDLSVRTSFVDAELALLNPATLFFGAVGAHRSFDVRIESDYAQSVTTLDAHPDGAAGHYVARDFDTLVDSPIALGAPHLEQFEVAGVPHTLATFGEGPFDHARAVADVTKIVEGQVAIFGSLPYPRYVFFNLLVERGGGLEHSNSCVLMTSRFATRTHKDYLDWLGLVSHELFHAWNVKRLRPVELGPFDYENEVTTESLWIAEGLTSYYADIVLARADLVTRDEYVERLSSSVEEIEGEPGQRLQPLSRASFDAWIRFYRPDENSPNVSVSYYSKGVVVGLLLDAKIRAATGGAKTLDDVMRAAYAAFSGEHGYSPAEFRAIASEVAGTSLDAFFARAVDGTDALDYAEANALFGLAIDESGTASDGGLDAGVNDPPAAYLGVETGIEGGRLIVHHVRRGTPAAEAGLNVDDELLAIGGFRVAPEGSALEERLTRYRAGETVELLVARRGRLVTLTGTLGSATRPTHRLSLTPGPTSHQASARDSWLGSP